jgi:hypothetical protein
MFGSFDKVIEAMAAKHGINPEWGAARPGIIKKNGLPVVQHEWEFLVGDAVAQFSAREVDAAVAEYFVGKVESFPDKADFVLERGGIGTGPVVHKEPFPVKQVTIEPHPPAVAPKPPPPPAPPLAPPLQPTPPLKSVKK